MRLGKWMWGVGFLALTSANCFVLPAGATENVQVVTRGRGERPDRIQDRGNRKPENRPQRGQTVPKQQTSQRRPTSQRGATTYRWQYSKRYHNPPKKHRENRFRRCPPKSIKVYHHNKCYYYHDGFFYRLCADGFYECFRPFIGMIVPMLPQIRVHVVHRGGLDCLLCEGVLYERIYTPHGIRYKVIGFI